MNVRPTKAGSLALVKSGLAAQLAALYRAQQEVATGKRILLPSDDPAGAARALSLRGRLGDVARWNASIDTATPLVGAASNALNDANGLLTRAKELALRASSSTMSAADRATIATELDALRESLFDLANTRYGDSYLFGGERTQDQPFVEIGSGANRRVVYRGDFSRRAIEIGAGSNVSILGPGANFFGPNVPRGPSIDGTSGVALGSTASEGAGSVDLTVRHDATNATFANGVALAAGGADDTFLGERALVIDAVAGTVRFGSGTARTLPTAGASDAANFVVRDENGAEIHLDFSSWSGASETVTAGGAGSIRLGTGEFSAIDFAQTDFELQDGVGGATLHLDLSGITRAGRDLVTFEGATNAFDVLRGIADDLRDSAQLSSDEFAARIGARMTTLDATSETVLAGIGSLGAQTERLTLAGTRLDALDIDLQGRLSDVEDVDVASAVLALTQAEQSLQLAQATGARLLQNTLLDYLR